ncbi:MAG TPA: sigma-70 family RNA polymerase sigma factor [Bryobacteraceae bacterium]|nr:sigma-70 family RNA polymerase sigma factor [Bryobacteraceae bacterium]
MAPRGHEVTQLLRAWSEGDQGALDRLMPMVYDELYRLARHYMAVERPGHTLQATALVNEAYLRLASAGPDFKGRSHFFAIAARVMRRILVDWARSRGAQKRGGDLPMVELDQNVAPDGCGAPWGTSSEDLIAIDDALKTLAKLDARKSEIVELRFFGGLSMKETAEVLRVSEETIRKDWNITKSWLKRELSRGQAYGG